MPEKPISVVSYAAGASLAAVALIYVFGPTFALDHDPAGCNAKKKTVVGLRNQANDCFINSVLQVLAGLGDLRVYLIRETHRRRIQDPAVYANLVQPRGTARLEPWRLQGLQDGLVTQGLKEMLDALNERPIYNKSVSPFPFVRVLEVAFKQRISRQQQDAQEFLQIVAERLKDEYHAGQRARFYAGRGSNGVGGSENGHDARHVAGVGGDGDGDGRGHGHASGPSDDDETTVGDGLTDDGEHEDGNPEDGKQEDGKQEDHPPGTPPPDSQTGLDPEAPAHHQMPLDVEEGFPMEGKYESQLECQTCGYKTKPREETFCTLTLAVPQVSSTSLNACFDGVFKTEYIDDFKCEMCRLLAVKANLEHELARSTSDTFAAQARDSMAKLQRAIETDPEKPPPGVDLGDMRHAPKRKIAKTTRISTFPKILALHLSRSIYGIGQMTTQKNSAKVAFPEELPLGGLADQHRYKLLGVVTHRGGHNSGHYEAFRRQNVPSPYHNANTFQQSDVYSKTPTPLSTPTPTIAPRSAQNSPTISTPDLLPSPPPPPRSVPAEVHSDSSSSPSNGNGNGNGNGRGREAAETGSLRSAAASTRSALWTKLAGQHQDLVRMPSGGSSKKGRRRRAAPDKWWRVSDEKVREAKTGEVLGMQREAYLLFYESER